MLFLFYFCVHITMKDTLFWLPRVLYKVYYLLISTSVLLLLFPFFYWATAKEERFPIAFRLKRIWSVIVHPLVGIFVKIEGISNLPKSGSYIVCANHTSYLDIALMYQIIPHYFIMMGKVEIRHWPLINRFFTTGMNILVDRQKNRGAHRAYMEAKAKIDRGDALVIFPEGVIPDFNIPKLKGFKNGAFKLAIEKKVPVVPVTLESNWKLLEGTHALKGKAGPGICKVIIHPPIATQNINEEDLISLRNGCRKQISEPLLRYYN